MLACQCSPKKLEKLILRMPYPTALGDCLRPRLSDTTAGKTVKQYLLDLRATADGSQRPHPPACVSLTDSRGHVIHERKLKADLLSSPKPPLRFGTSVIKMLQ
ncbi:unnamed protein product [Schistocephalus solidus]|uniref:Uncharacterized protein n=1 Tax=Schistocephalus solidus TaxID=70667 RepID=A0A183SHI9_SCHSO|nr:unnamed protein product [Schistocephalus solidus]